MENSLDYVISALEQRKGLKTVEITQKSVLEILTYLKELKGKQDVITTLQETLNATQGLREELIVAVKNETVDKTVDYVKNYTSLVYAYVPKDPLIEFLENLKRGE